MYRRTGRGRVLLLVFVALSLLLITLDFRNQPGSPLERAKDVSVAVVAPLQRGFTTVFRPVGDFFSSIGEIGDLRAENSRLTSLLEELETEVGESATLELENVRLKEILDLRESWATMDSASAEVFGHVPFNYRWAVFIDKGRADGVRPDMAVIDPDGLVGKVIQAEEHQATVLLLIDPNAGAAARIEGREATGAIVGKGANEPLSLQFLAKDAEAFEGDTVVTSGYNRGIFPPGIPIGYIDEIHGDARALRQEVEVQPYADFTDLDYVLVLLETGDRLEAGAARGD